MDQNYFNYFTEIEEQFLRRRGGGLLLTTLDWALIETWKPCGLVIGLPLSLDGAERSAAKETRTIAEKFQRSLGVPIYLQDERLTTFAAESEMKSRGRSEPEIKREVDSEAAAIILRDFIEAREHD